MTTTGCCKNISSGSNVPLLTCLTPNSIKQTVFSKDESYLGGMADLRQYWTQTDELIDVLWNTAALIFRPDAIAGGRCADTLPALREFGFVPVAYCPVQLSRERTRKLWKYQANVSSPERLAILDLIMTSGESLYVLLHDRTSRQNAPATVHLNYLKGTAIVRNRKRWHLRTIAGPAVANILSYIHIADDPADLIRELSCLMSRASIRMLYDQLSQCDDRTEDVRRLILELQAKLPPSLLEQDRDRRLLGPTRSQLETATSVNLRNLSSHDLRLRWHHIVARSRKSKVFVTGDSYDGMQATVPDDTKMSLPLDSHLIFSELGPR